MAVPSIVTICLDCLAENAGYIVDLDGVPCEAVLEICKRAAPSGLINLEVVLADAIRSSDIATLLSGRTYCKPNCTIQTSL